MKKITAMFLGLLMVLGLTACGGQRNENGGGSQAAQTSRESTEAEGRTEAAEESDEAETEKAEDSAKVSGGKTLIVYYSATGNTEEVAGYIAAATGGDTFLLEPKEAYSSDDLNWRDENSRVTREHDNPDERAVELENTAVPDWESYDTVFIGYPNMEQGFESVLCV